MRRFIRGDGPSHHTGAKGVSARSMLMMQFGPHDSNSPTQTTEVATVPLWSFFQPGRPTTVHWSFVRECFHNDFWDFREDCLPASMSRWTGRLARRTTRRSKMARVDHDAWSIGMRTTMTAHDDSVPIRNGTLGMRTTMTAHNDSVPIRNVTRCDFVRTPVRPGPERPRQRDWGHR